MYRYAIILLCYLIGAIPTSYLFVQFFARKDIRQLGSGNSGATNAARVLGLWSFFTILCIDASKAYAAVLCAQWQGLAPEWVLGAAAAVVLGNSFSPFLGFAGGKGVATLLGVLCFLFSPLVIVGYLVIFALTYVVFRRVDVASLTASAAGIGVVWSAGYSSPLLAAASIGAFWVWARHWNNIYRLVKGK